MCAKLAARYGRSRWPSAAAARSRRTPRYAKQAAVINHGRRRGQRREMTLARLDAEHVHAARVGQLLPRVLLRLGLEHGVLFGRIRDERHGSVAHPGAELPRDVGI